MTYAWTLHRCASGAWLPWKVCSLLCHATRLWMDESCEYYPVSLLVYLCIYEAALDKCAFPPFPTDLQILRIGTTRTLNHLCK